MKCLFTTIPLFIFSGTWCTTVQAHHILGRPAYSISENSATPPSMQVETQIGDYFITCMVFPAFLKPDQPGRIKLYATRIDDGKPFQGDVSFKVRDDIFFNQKEELLGVQVAIDNVYRQDFEFRETGKYIIRAEFESGGEPYLIDFPLQIGDRAPFGPIGVTVGVLLFILISVNLFQRKRLLTTKIRDAHKDRSP